MASNEIDLFKIREPIGKTVDKKRGTGIPTLKGAVCSTSKDKDYLMNIIKKIPNITKKDIERINNLTREEICNEIKEKLLFLEKYSTSKDKNKLTYVMIPDNHPLYQFPYNLEDRVKYRQKQIDKILERDMDYKVDKKKEKDLPVYEISFKNERFVASNVELKSKIEKIGCKLDGSNWKLILN